MSPARRSAGVLLYRRADEGLEIFLVHPGGPYWAKKDEGAWSIPKGEHAPDESPVAAARRELREETGFEVPAGAELVPLTEVRQAGGKLVAAWAVEHSVDPAALVSNTFRMQWPPGSGNEHEFPEVDRAAWFSLAEAKSRILPGQVPILEELAERLAGDGKANG